ncbi:MAG: methionyl-tRNA formyltransferase [Candidatus Daviesbacteria bacterium]|nr:methionyl-tRNA formyltransferase [Candidatus Daviesbacteria bacterium]
MVKHLKNLKIVFFGTPHFVIPVLKTLEDNFDVVAVVTAPDNLVGRTQTLTPSPIKEAFKKTCLTPKIFDEEVSTKLKSLEPDLFIVAAYGKIIPQEILDIPKFGSINIHPSLLPKYRGASPIQESILNGDEISGVTFIKMDSEVDHGPIIFTKEFRLSKEDTFESLSKKVFILAAEDLIKIIPEFITGKINLCVQDHAIASYCNRITKEDGYFDLPFQDLRPAGRQVTQEFLEKLDRMIRAYYPWPTAWTKWSPFAKASGDKNEKIVKFLPEGMVQIEGKKPTDLDSFLRGYPNFPIRSLK